jgi:hypothetical protein
MINIKYDREENSLRVELQRFTYFKPDELPLLVEYNRAISGLIQWSSPLPEGTWCVWNGGENLNDVVITTANGKHVMTRKFNVELDGDHIEKLLYMYIKNLDHRPKGMVIGSHDGTFGHWTIPVFEGLSDAIIIDGSAPQFEEVKKNYAHLDNLKFYNEIVTVAGGEVDWMMGGSGFTDTIYKPVINIFLSDDQISHTTRQSIGINELLEREGCEELDWLHLDVEGIDGDLILALKYRPTVIIFETMHINQQQMSKLLDWFQDNDYNMFNDGSNAICIKK